MFLCILIGHRSILHAQNQALVVVVITSALRTEGPQFHPEQVLCDLDLKSLEISVFPSAYTLSFTASTS